MIDDEGFSIFMCEVESILNSCFLMVFFDDFRDLEFLMLNYFLLLKFDFLMFLGIF